MPVTAPDSSEPAFHDWSIEKREIRRHVARRGRQHAFESLDPRRTALVVIDMVPFFVRESAYRRGIVPKINEVADGLRRAGGLVTWVLPGHHEPTAKDRELLGSEIAETYARSGGERGRCGTTWLSPTRTRWSRRRHTARVSPTAARCRISSPRATSTRSSSPVADGCAAMRDRDHNATLHVVYRSYGDVRPTSEVLEPIESGAATCL